MYMTLQQLQDSLPNYAKDIKLNLSSLLNNDAVLSEQQLLGTLLATSMASKNKHLFTAIMKHVEGRVSIEALNAAKSASALMAMNNIYYRFTHLVSDSEYAKLPAQLRMNAMMQPEVDKIDFELFSLAVSAIHGCGKCLDAHEKVLSKHGISREKIQYAVRLASVVHATAVVLAAENIA
jgi:alkyl hydroperoxide reductase subunit D